MDELTELVRAYGQYWLLAAFAVIVVILLRLRSMSEVRPTLDDNYVVDEEEDFTCDNCGEIGELTECAGCDIAYCDTCAERLLNDEDECPDCLGEEVLACGKCGEEFAESNLDEDGVCDECNPDVA